MVRAQSSESGEGLAVFEAATRLLANVERVVVGKQDQISLILAALISGGHVLLEDVPGTAKTILARAIAQSVTAYAFAAAAVHPRPAANRHHGAAIFDQRTREFEFRPGPVFANVLLVDEVNRAMPRTQSALLEAMAEHQVTVDGVTHPLPSPFLVIATENPIDQEGTFPLPEAQLDRFALRAGLGYPDEDEEVAIVVAQRHGHPDRRARGGDRHRRVQGAAGARSSRSTSTTCCSPGSCSSCATTREVDGVALGASVRGSLTLERTARAWALLQGRDHVIPEDVERLFLPVLGHRLLLTASYYAETHALGRDAALEQIRARCLELAPPPAPEDWER